MRNRKIVPSLQSYEKETNEEFSEVSKETAKVKTPDCMLKELEGVLKSLKMKQSQDMKGYTNEIFHLKNIGCIMKQSLLVLFNKMKQNIQIPKSLNQAFIKSIPKKKKDPMSLDSEQGIFLVNKMRKILMSLINNSMINVIEDNLSQSNIGAR